MRLNFGNFPLAVKKSVSSSFTGNFVLLLSEKMSKNNKTDANADADDDNDDDDDNDQSIRPKIHFSQLPSGFNFFKHKTSVDN